MTLDPRLNAYRSDSPTPLPRAPLRTAIVTTGRAVIDVERVVLRRDMPRPGGADRATFDLGNEPEITRTLPSRKMRGDKRHRRCRGAIRLIGGDRQEIPQYVKIVLRRRPAISSESEHQLPALRRSPSVPPPRQVVGLQSAVRLANDQPHAIDSSTAERPAPTRSFNDGSRRTWKPRVG